MDKRAYANKQPAFFSAADEKNFKAVANRHTITFLILISLAVAGVLLVGILGLVYHKYSKKEIKASFPSRSSSNRKVSYGFEGADDMEEKELARKTQIYHYQHQKRMMASMESRRSNHNSVAGSEVDCSQVVDGSTIVDGRAASSAGMNKVASDDALLLDKSQSSNENLDQAAVGKKQSSGGQGTISGLKNSLLRMRSQGSVGCSSGQTKKDSSGGNGAKVIHKSQQRSLDRATPPSFGSSAYRQGRVASPEKVGEEYCDAEEQSSGETASVITERSSSRGAAGGSVGRPAGYESEGELGVDYTVYECPGLAPSGEMIVKNPLFNGEYPEANATDEEEEEEEE